MPIGRALRVCRPGGTIEALDDSGQEQLHADLTALAATHDRAPGPSVAMASEYLEAIAVRR